MKLVLSAYTCAPNRGSEPGVAWNWALEIARLGHQVWVLTRAYNRTAIEVELAKSPPTKNLNFLYYDPPLWLTWWRKGDHGIRLYYLLWQWGAYRLAKKMHATQQFDLVHHITFGTLRFPSFMGRIGIPFVLGPAGGGERAPWRLRIGYSLRGWIWDLMRDFSNLLVRFSPLMHSTFQQAEVIHVTTDQSFSLLPKKYRAKASVLSAIGIDANPTSQKHSRTHNQQMDKRELSVLFVGRLLSWKGLHLGIQAFAILSKKKPQARMTVVGRGPEEKRLRAQAKALGIADRIEWKVSFLSNEALEAVYRGHSVFLFPSLHDSGGMAVLEALANGLPVVCLDLGGPGNIVTENCGRVIKTSGESGKTVIKSMAESLELLANRNDLRHALSIGALERASEFSWHIVVGKIYRKAK